MRGHKQDPYRYEKEKFMENTAKLRGELTTKARKDRLESSLAALPGHLEQIWSDASHSARERRGVLYAMWREAAGSDDEVGAAGRKARATIEAFIRERLPEAREDAFTDDELRRFNARAGAVKFEPYARSRPRYSRARCSLRKSASMPRTRAISDGETSRVATLSRAARALSKSRRAWPRRRARP